MLHTPLFKAYAIGDIEKLLKEKVVNLWKVDNPEQID